MDIVLCGPSEESDGPPFLPLASLLPAILVLRFDEGASFRGLLPLASAILPSLSLTAL